MTSGKKMDWRYKSLTTHFGTDAEAYVSRLLLLMVNPNGSRRPDLVSVNGRYNPRLSIEVKSGRGRKGVLVDYQLHYAITNFRDYTDLFGLDTRAPQGVLEGLDIAGVLPNTDVAYYYDIIDRKDDNKTGDIGGEYSTIKIKWGDQHIVPHQFGFYAFAVSRHIRTGEPLNKIIENLWEIIKQDVLIGANYEKRKGDKKSWQSIHGRDVLAIFLDDESVATEDGKRRIELIRKVYSGLTDLRRVQISGPDGTSIYALVEPEHYDLFNRQLRRTVADRRGVIEKIARQRRRAVDLLDRIKFVDMPRLAFGEKDAMDLNHLSEEGNAKSPTERERRRLELLVGWRGDFREDEGAAVSAVGEAPF